MSDFETITRIIQERRSVFPPMYEDKEIEDEVIRDILNNANWAPTHRKTEPWRFKILKGQKKSELAEFLVDHYKSHTPSEDFSSMKLKKTKKKVLKSAAVIAICMKRDPNESVPEWEEIAAVACAVQNMWLTCTTLGIGSYWSTPKSIEDLGGFLNLKEGEKCLGLFYMGFMKDAVYTSERTSIENKVEWL
ncbi:nitroreductase family protein [Portibacter marinus]|uniref:nitroreductase family protein n=1 Tax=Portibacter marinus TaxID=2898660 RepID=UPI001F442B8E|nr:nitroreductase [Portibacter marinus]